MQRDQAGPGRGLRTLTAGLCLALAFVLPTTASATKFAGAFMENGGGARALGMGGAFTAVADDPSATFWNPAGLSGVSRRELLLMHSERFGDLIDRDFAAYVQPVDWSLFGGSEAGLGISLIRLGVDDIPFTEHLLENLDDNGDGDVSRDELLGTGQNDDTDGLGLFDFQDQIRYKSDQEFALLVSYGERLGAWKMGATLKFVRQSVGSYSSLGVGADLAFLRPQLWRRLDFGVKLQDITTTYLSWNTESGRNEVIAPAVVPGFAWRQPLPDWNMDLTLAASVETRFEDRGDADLWTAGSISANPHVGLEAAFSRRVFLRGGFDSGFASGDVTAGAGFIVEPLTIDYAYAGDSLDIDEVTHRISASFRF